MSTTLLLPSTLGVLLRNADAVACGYGEPSDTADADTVTALLVTFTEYGMTDGCGRCTTLPTHHVVGFLCRHDADRYLKFHKCSDGSDFFMSNTINVALRPCIVRKHVKSSVLLERGYSARYGYVGGVLFILSDSDEQYGKRRSAASFASEAIHITSVNGIETFVAGNTKYRIVATD